MVTSRVYATARSLGHAVREALLLAGLASGEPRPVTDEDWEKLRRRALAGTEIRKSG